MLNFFDVRPGVSGADVGGRTRARAVGAGELGRSCCCCCCLRLRGRRVNLWLASAASLATLAFPSSFFALVHCTSHQSLATQSLTVGTCVHAGLPPGAARPGSSIACGGGQDRHQQHQCRPECLYPSRNQCRCQFQAVQLSNQPRHRRQSRLVVIPSLNRPHSLPKRGPSFNNTRPSPAFTMEGLFFNVNNGCDDLVVMTPTTASC